MADWIGADMAEVTRCLVVFEDGTQCPRTVYANGWCNACYSWARNNAKDPNGRRPRRRKGELDAALQAAAEATTDECIILTGYAKRPVVGNATRLPVDSKGVNASRAVWIIAHGDPGKAHVLHSCNGGSGATGCINIRHLYLGDEARNKLDMVESGHTLRGLTHNPGETNGNAVLTEAQVLDIRRRFQRGRPYHPGNVQQLAEEFGVLPSSIRNVISRRTWKHI
jgi:hypothetical protein